MVTKSLAGRPWRRLSQGHLPKVIWNLARFAPTLEAVKHACNPDFPMVGVYKIPPQTVRREKQRVAAGVITLFVAVPLSVGVFAVLGRVDVPSLTTHDVGVFLFGLGLPSAALWTRTIMLRSLRIELEDSRITMTQDRLFWGYPLRISFSREEISHIREVGKSGLMVRGLGTKGRYIDLHIPPFVENYDELKGRLSAWQPVHKSWL
jgi:hypothetical protein